MQNGEAQQISVVTQTMLRHHRIFVKRNGTRCDIQTASDVFHRQPTNQQSDDLGLPTAYQCSLRFKDPCSTPRRNAKLVPPHPGVSTPKRQSAPVNNAVTSIPIFNETLSCCQQRSYIRS